VSLILFTVAVAANAAFRAVERRLHLSEPVEKSRSG
jgi:hypothetical protein